MVNPYSQIAKDNLSNENNIEKWTNEFNTLKENLLNQKSNNIYKEVYGKFQSFCPYQQYITLDCLNKEDWPSNIAQNSIYLCFLVDFIERKVEIHSSGHVWISDKDKEIYPQYKYLAMHSMTGIAKHNGVKLMRKSKFKSIDDLTGKILNAFNNIMNEVIDYTGGYPYKKGIKELKNN